MPDQPAAAAPPPAPAKSPLLRLYEGNRPAAAALAFLALEIVPVLGLVASARENWDAWTTPALLLGVAGLAGPLGILLGRSWGLIAASYASWAGLVLVVLHAMTLGLTPLRLAPAGAYAAVLASLSSLARPGDPSRPGASPELPVGAWLKENVEAIIVAFIMALVIRCFGIEVFKIPSSSMEPTLLGDVTDRHSAAGCIFPNVHVTRGGDRIMVTKFFYAAAEIERYDVVVFKFPLNQSRNFIKRVVGLPDEEFMLFHGNIYTRKPGETDFKIARRPQRTQDSLWIDPAGVRSFFEDPAQFENYWDVDGPKPVVGGGELSYDAPLPSGGTSIRFKGDLHDHDGAQVADVRVAFELTPTTAQGEVVAEIQNVYGRFELRLSAAEDGQLRWYDSHEKIAQPTQTQPFPARLDLDRRIRVELGVYDGLAYARVDGAGPRIEFIRVREDVKRLLGSGSTIRFGGRNGAFRMRNLKVGRDVHYRPGKYTYRFEEDKPRKISPGHYVVMGDNVTSSHDSRGWEKLGFLLQGRDEPVIYEKQQEDDPELTPTAVRNRYDLKVAPSKVVTDKFGRVWALYSTDPGPLPAGVPAGVIKDELKPEDFFEIPEPFIIGKALWVWWPPGRWFKLIR